MQARLQAVRDRTVFFVGGPAKSGTTWLQHLLNAHPRIACRGEGHLTRALFPMLKSATEKYNQRIGSYNEGLFSETSGFPTLEQDELRHLATTAVALLLGRIIESQPDVRAVGEKTPANIHEYPLLSWLFPRSRLVCIVRDPRDCLASNWHQTRRVNPKWLAEKHQNSLTRFAEAVGRNWAHAISEGLKMARLCPDQVHFLRYEDLHSDPVRTLQPVFQLLGIDTDEKGVQGCIEKASFQRLSRGRSPGEEDAGSFFRKGVIGDWRELLDAEAETAVLDSASELMRQFGYLDSETAGL